MLHFFRKYQRYLFIFIAVVIVISFSFFGTHQMITSSTTVEDYSIGKAIDGSQMKKKEIDAITRFLWSDRMDLQLKEKGLMPNFFNDGVIRKDFFSTGLGVMLAEHYFESLQEGLKEKIEVHQTFRPYRHPTASFISAEVLWEQLLPSQKENLDRFLNENLEANPATFALLVDLYLGESTFPPHVLREYLMLQQKHYNWIQIDRALPQINLNLFHCHSIEDWFGSDFLNLISQFIYNTAIIAREKGYKVSKEEARVDLFRNGYLSLLSQKHSEKVDQHELGKLWRKQLLSLEMDEKRAVSVWQKVMLMRRLFEDYGHATLLDSHQYETFHSYASKTAIVDHYQLPPALHFKTFHSMLKFIFYCNAIAGEKLHGNELPKQFAPIASIEKIYPELLQTRFLVEVAEIKKEDLAEQITLKEMWDWQLQKENFKKLQKQFPELATSKAEETDSFFTALEALSPSLRKQVDHYSRMQLIELHPNLLLSALDNQTPVVKEIAISPNGFQTTFPSIDNALELLTLFTLAPIKGTLEPNQAALNAKSKLETYTPDHLSYFRFRLLDKDLEKSVLTFSQANKQGILDKLLDQHLKESYESIRNTHPTLFKKTPNQWKPFEDAKQEVGKLIYQETLSAIDQNYLQAGGHLSESRLKKLDTFYPRYYFYSYMKRAQKDIRQNGHKSAYLMQKVISDQNTHKLPKQPPLNTQWNLIAQSKTYKNHESSPWFDQSLFAMVEKSWSSIKVSKKGELNFFQLKEKSVPEETHLKDIKRGREILSMEAERFLMTEILDSLKRKKAIHLKDSNVK